MTKQELTGALFAGLGEHGPSFVARLLWRFIQGAEIAARRAGCPLAAQQAAEITAAMERVVRLTEELEMTLDSEALVTDPPGG